MFEKYTTNVTVGNKEVTLKLYDTAGECLHAEGFRVLPEGFPRWDIPAGRPGRPPWRGPDSPSLREAVEGPWLGAR